MRHLFCWFFFTICVYVNGFGNSNQGTNGIDGTYHYNTILLPNLGYTTHLSSKIGNDGHTIELFYENPQDQDFAYLWTRVTCEVTVDLYKVSQKCVNCGHNTTENSENLNEENAGNGGSNRFPLQLNVPEDQRKAVEIVRRNGTENVKELMINTYRLLHFEKQDCLVNENCWFDIVVYSENEISDDCRIDIKTERGFVLPYGSFWDYNITASPNSLTQLYAILPESEKDFPLHISLKTESTGRVVLQHSWGFTTTIYQSYHDGSFEIAIPLNDKFILGEYFFFWVTIIEPNHRYSIRAGPSDIQQNLFLDVSPVILCLSLLFLVIFACCCYHFLPSRIQSYNLNVPNPVTIEELRTIDIVLWKDIQDIDPENNKCTICLEFFQKDEELRKLPCSHYFHYYCIDYWLLKQQRRCPICKQDVKDATDYVQQAQENQINEERSASFFTHPCHEGVDDEVTYE